jgi:hypothetical protein
MFYEVLDSPYFPVGFFLVLLLGVFIGRRFAMKEGATMEATERHSEFRSWAARPVETVVMGLLALLLAFLFQFAGENYAESNKAIKRECDLIAGTYRYAKLLKEPDKSRLERWVAKYAENLSGPNWRTEVTDLNGPYILAVYKSHDDLWLHLQQIGAQEKPTVLYENLTAHSEAMIESHYGTLYEIRTRLPWAMIVITIT